MDYTIPGTENMAMRRKWIFSVIMGCGRLGDDTDHNTRLLLYDVAWNGLATVTPRELLQVFPVAKRYDGERFQCKDYFYTMDAIREHGMDTPLGAQPYELLTEYVNHHVMHFVVRHLCAIADARRAQGKLGPLEELMHASGVASYTKLTGADGRELTRNNLTGAVHMIVPAKPRMPRWWKIIERQPKHKNNEEDTHNG